MGRWSFPAAGANLFVFVFACILVATNCEQNERPLVIVENRGNSSFECIKSGPCVRCSLAENQNDDIYHCASTGYYMPYQCVEVNEDGSLNVTESENATGTSKVIFQKQKQQKQQQQQQQQKPMRKMLRDQQAEGGKQLLIINKSCIPPLEQERLTVLGFEGIMLGLLGVFSPVLYYRKKKGFQVSGMTRIPSSSSSARF